MRAGPVFRLGGMAAGLVVISLAAASCGLAPYVAKVNGQVITRAQLFSELNAVGGNPADSANLASQGIPVHGKAKGSYTTTFADDILDEEISVVLVAQGDAKRKVTVTADDTSLARNDMVSAAGGAKAFATLPMAYQSYLVTSAAQYTALEASLGGVSLSQSSVNTYFATHTGALSDDCVSIIVVPTMAEVTSIDKQLKKGTSFASLAMKDSADTSTGASGGAAGCSIPAAFSQRYGPGVSSVVTSVPVGQVGAPVHVFSSSGQPFFILAKVTSRTAPTLAGATPVILGNLLNPAMSKLNTYLAALTKAAKIVVDPSYGRFTISSGNPDVLAPTGPPAADLVLPNGLTPTTVAGSTGPGTPATTPPTTPATTPPTTPATAPPTTKTTSATTKTTPPTTKTTSATTKTTSATTQTTPTTKATVASTGG